MKRAWIAAALLAAPAAAAGDPHTLALAAGYKAAFLCSGRWNAGQGEAAITRDDLTGIYREVQEAVTALPATIDEQSRTVSVKFANAMPPRIAVWRPLLGCVQLPPGATAAADVPRLVPGLTPPNLAAMDAKPWPLGDAGAVQPLKRKRDRAALEAVVARAFDSDRTTAVIVLKDGRIIAERYRADWTMHTPQRTWSVAKSLTATLVGRAVQLGQVDVTQPAPVPQWQAPSGGVADPRAAISWSQLLRMQSGLWTAGPGNRTDEVYLGGALVAQTAATMPLEHAPGTHFNYSNNDIMLAALALSRVVAAKEGAGDGGSHAALAFPFTELLWPLGMTRTTPETDWRGDFVLSSQVWMTARDLARLALLYQNGGRAGIGAGGQQLLPPDWPAFVERADGPQPLGRPEGYGAGFWRWGGLGGGLGGRAGVPPLPAGTYAMNGNRGQYAVIVPGRNIIVIRRGFDLPAAPFPMPGFAAEVVAALEKITK